MLEASHHSLIHYRLPTTGEVVPLLQIAPSKTDQERVLLVSPELADVLSTIITRVRDPRTGEECRTPTSEEWDAFLGHFERRKLSVGICARDFGTAWIHEHACIRCSMLRLDPAQRPRLTEIRDNLLARILEAEREGWLGEMEGLKASLAGAQDKLALLDAEQARARRTVDLGMPSFANLAGRTSTAHLTRRSSTH